MQVAVTGAAGKLGREVVGQLRAAGHAIRAIDQVAMPGGRVTDLRDRDSVWASLDGVDGIVHLAAWPTPHSADPATVFSDNVLMASNVLHAAAAQGIANVVVASSQSVLGLAWSTSVVEPDYLPVDESHPCRPSDSYSLSKLVTEQLARMLSVQGKLHATVLRFPVIWTPDAFEACVAGRLLNPAQGAKSQWAYVDVRDAARAIQLALEQKRGTFDLFNICAPTVFAAQPTAGLVAEWYSQLAARGDAPAGQGACLDWRAARQRLGFVCRYRWSETGISEVDTPA